MKRLYRYQQETILKSKAREKAFTDVKKSPRKHQMVIGTTGLVISGGLVYWNSYSTMWVDFFFNLNKGSITG